MSDSLQNTNFEWNAAENFVAYSNFIGKLGNSIKRIEESVQKNLSSGSPSGALLVIQQHMEVLGVLSKHDKLAVDEIFGFRDQLRIIVDKSADEFPAGFPNAIESLGINFCEGSIHPTYILDKGFMEVRFNSRELYVQIITRGGREQIFGIEIATVVKAIQDNLERLHNRQIGTSELRDRIYKTFQDTKSNQKEDLGYVKIRDFIKVYQKNYKCLVDESIIDLSNAYKQFEALKLDYIRDHEQGLQLYGFEDHGFYGFMRLER